MYFEIARDSVKIYVRMEYVLINCHMCAIIIYYIDTYKGKNATSLFNHSTAAFLDFLTTSFFKHSYLAPLLRIDAQLDS